VLFTINQSCVSMAAVFLLWGSMRFLGLPIPQRLSIVFGVFLAVWILVSPQMMKDSLQIHLPVFILLSLSSPFTAVCFLRMQKQKAFVGVGMLSLGFLLWVIYLGSYPFPREYGSLYGAGFVIAAVLQVLIAVSMTALLFQELRRETQQLRAEIEAVRQEQSKFMPAKEAGHALSNRISAPEETEKTVSEMQRARRTLIEREHLQALGQMAGDVAHDINNALSPIAAYSEMLLSTLPDLATVPRQRLQRISKAAEDVAQIVAHMREFYRPGLDSDSPPTRNINQALENGLELDPYLAPRDTNASCRPLRILCIDDELQLRQLMHDVLELEHHQVTVATGGREGLDLFLANFNAGQPYEVVITDLEMPDLDGHHVARAIKAESPRTPVIMLTGWGMMMKTDWQTGPEVDAVIGKPLRMQELSNLLFQITERNAT
jgi:CheY-like chemotaxis protein